VNNRDGRQTKGELKIDVTPGQIVGVIFTR